MTEHVPAAAEGMPKITRRRFLAQLGITTGAVAASTAVVAVERATAPEENPELLRLGKVLAETSATFEKADREKQEARARYLQIAPQTPEELVLPRGDRLIHLTETEKDIDGKIVWLTNAKGSFLPKDVAYAAYLEMAVLETDGRTIMGKRVRKLLRIAKPYEEAIEQAKDVSGWNDAELAQYHAGRELVRLTEEIFEIEARTMVGIEIKARAMVAAMCPEESVRFYPVRWGQALAQSVIAVAGGRA